MTRNSGKGTLSLWTHNLQDMEYRDSFIPQGCKDDVGRVMIVGAGAPSGDAHIFADKHDSVILGPYSPSVAVSGGWLLGGGHGVLGPVYGMGADRVVEFQIVTPDGKERVVNKCQNPDLFFALRGGGGSSFGVVLNATHSVIPREPIAFADVHLPSNISPDTALEWIKLLVDESLEWGHQGWGGHVAGTVSHSRYIFLEYRGPFWARVHASGAGDCEVFTLYQLQMAITDPNCYSTLRTSTRFLITFPIMAPKLGHRSSE